MYEEFEWQEEEKLRKMEGRKRAIVNRSKLCCVLVFLCVSESGQGYRQAKRKKLSRNIILAGLTGPSAGGESPRISL